MTDTSKTELLDATHKVSELLNEDLVAASISAVNKLLVAKGIFTVEEIQKEFQECLKERGVTLESRNNQT